MTTRTWTTAALAALVMANAGWAQEKKSWTDSVTLNGDVRYRYQSSEEEGRTGQPRERHRFRARLSLSGVVNEDIKVGIRLVTNAGDPISDNQTMSGSFDDKSARFDRAFIDWKIADGLNLIAGKMGQPWIAVSDLVFSGEVNPEGLALKGKLSLDGGAELLGTVGYFILEERSSADETTMFSGQGALRFKPGAQSSVLIGASIYAYDTVEGQTLFFNPTSAFGNSTQSVGEEEEAYLVYNSGFTVVEGFAQAGFDIGLPVVIGAQYAVNTDADADDTAFLYQIKLGRASAPGSWEFGYQYRELEKDSVLGVLAENTDTGNATNVKAHIPYVRYVVSRNFDVKLQYAMATKGLTDGKSLDTFKADFAVKF